MLYVSTDLYGRSCSVRDFTITGNVLVGLRGRHLHQDRL